MSLKLLFALMAAAGLLGAVIGFVFRWLLVLSRKCSIEVEVKQIVFDAREEAKQITSEAEVRAKELVAHGEESLKEKEEKITRSEERVFKREEQLDKKQAELDSEIQAVKGRIEEAREQLFKELERENEEDMMIRAAKLERDGQEKLERRAKEILTTAIHRLGNAVSAD